MSVTFQCGGTGSGKSYRTCQKHFIPELIDGNRVVVTNLPLRLPELAEFLEREYPEANIDLRKRLVLIDEDGLPEFWRYRPYGYRVPVVTKEQSKAGVLPDFMHCVREDKSLFLQPEDFPAKYRRGGEEALRLGIVWPEDPNQVPDVMPSKALPGVVYLLDELHTAFAAKDWARHGNEFLFYLTQRRKFGQTGDKVVAITQYPGQVAKDFREHCQDWRYTQNHGRIAAAFGVRRPEIMTETRYLEIKTPGATPVGMSKFKVDPKGIGSIYDTDAGVGIGGGGDADKKEKIKGLPWWSLGIPIGIAAVLMFFGPDWAGKGIARAVDPPRKAPAAQGVTKTGSAQGEVAQESDRRTVERVADLEAGDPDLYVTGTSTADGQGFAWLSDGRKILVGPPRVSLVTEKGLVLDGIWIPFEKYRPKRRAAQYGESPAPGEYTEAAPKPVYQAPAPSYAQNSQASALANPGATGSRRIRIMGFDGNTHAVRTIERRADETANQVEEFDGDGLGG